MEITEVKVFPVNEEKLKAYITIVFDDSFIVRDLKIISGNSGLFVAMPSKRRKDGTYKDIAHPLNQSTRRKFEEIILDAYLKEIKGEGGASSGGGGGEKRHDAEAAYDAQDTHTEHYDPQSGGESGSGSGAV